MKAKTLGLVHTSATLVPVFAQLCKEKLPGVNVFNIADDSLVKGIMAAGSLTPTIARRVAGYLESAELAGADYIMVTCSSIGPCRGGRGEIDWCAGLARGPAHGRQSRCYRKKPASVLSRCEQPWNHGGLRSLCRAAQAGKQIELTSRLCEGAFEALMSGEAAAHDAKVATALKELSHWWMSAALAQASMARVVDTLAPEDKRVPILASPGIAVDFLATVLRTSAPAFWQGAIVFVLVASAVSLRFSKAPADISSPPGCRCGGGHDISRAGVFCLNEWTAR